MLFSCFTVSNAVSTSLLKGKRKNLLPLRELLTNLGVANNDQHIIWDRKEKSVTAIKDYVKLYLKVGDTNAKVNDQNLTIDAASVNYNSRVYIPAKFTAP